MFKSVCKALGINKRPDQAESSDSSPPIPYVKPCPLDPLLDSSSALKVLEDYKVVDYIFLDLGSCGQVYRIQTSKDKSVPLTCLKVIPAADSGHESCNSMLERAQNEVDIVRKLSHPHIIQLLHHKAYKSSLNPYVNAYFTMHFELCAKKLFTLITEKQKARTLACRPLFERFFRQISSALAFIHAHHVVHHDLNGNNIMVVDDAAPDGLHFKIIDFGCAHQYPEETFSTKETDDESDNSDSMQTSPSKATSRKRSKPNGYIPFYAEVYAFAIVALQVAVGLNRRPKQVEIRRAGRAAWMRAFQQEGRLRHVPERMQEVMLKVLEKCNENRVSMSDVVEFIQDQ